MLFFARKWSCHPAVCGAKTLLCLFSMHVKSKAFGSFIAFQASLGSVCIILSMLPAWKCSLAVGHQCGSAEPVFPVVNLWLPVCLQDEVTVLLSWVLWVLILWGTSLTQNMWSRPQFRSAWVLANSSVGAWTSCWSRQFSLAYNRYHPFDMYTEWVMAQHCSLASTGQHSAVMWVIQGETNPWSCSWWCKTTTEAKKGEIPGWSIHSTPPRVVSCLSFIIFACLLTLETITIGRAT